MTDFRKKISKQIEYPEIYFIINCSIILLVNSLSTVCLLLYPHPYRWCRWLPRAQALNGCQYTPLPPPPCHPPMAASMGIRCCFVPGWERSTFSSCLEALGNMGMQKTAIHAQPFPLGENGWEKSTLLSCTPLLPLWSESPLTATGGLSE